MRFGVDVWSDGKKTVASWAIFSSANVSAPDFSANHISALHIFVVDVSAEHFSAVGLSVGHRFL